METIHLKTVDPLSQELLRSASQRGIELPWDRYEKLQPQDGFLRLGLSCPYGCLQGPCRIDPFGRGSKKGACGLGRDEMAAAMLLRLCHQGTLDALTTVPLSAGIPSVTFSTALTDMVGLLREKSGQRDPVIEDIFASGAMLQRSSLTSEQLLSQSLRLSLLSLGILEQHSPNAPSGPIKCTAGYGTLKDHPIRIGFSGMVATELVEAIAHACRQEINAEVTLVSLGQWIVLNDQFLPIACTSGESELLLSSGAIHLLVAGPGTDPGLIDICRQLDIPVVVDGDRVEATEVVHRVRTSRATLSQVDLFANTSPAGEGDVVMSSEDMGQLFANGVNGQVAVIGGPDTLQLSLGQIPLELATSLRDRGMPVAAWGDAALWMMKNNMGSKEHDMPMVTLDHRQGPLLVVKALAAAGQIDRLQGVCFTGLKSSRELAMALGLAYLGCRVSVATPIPILGSQAVCDMLNEMLQQNGGHLRHFDHPPQTREILDWFTGV